MQRARRARRVRKVWRVQTVQRVPRRCGHSHVPWVMRRCHHLGCPAGVGAPGLWLRFGRQPLQTVHITPSTDVRLDFHFPPTVKLAQRVRVLALGDGSATPSLVGELAQGGRVSTRAVAGAKFKVVEVVKGLDRPLLQITVGLCSLWLHSLFLHLPHTRLTPAL